MPNKHVRYITPLEISVTRLSLDLHFVVISIIVNKISNQIYTYRHEICH